MENKSILNTENYYTEYFVDDSPRPTIVVSPGGGYKYTSPRESKPVADVFTSYGYHVVVVHYRQTVKDSHPLPAVYLAEVIKILQKDQRCSHIIGMGFSAGGHNMLEVCLHPQTYRIQKVDLLVLGYPVITSKEEYWHQGSFENLLLDDFSNLEKRKSLSLETQVDENAPDLFLWSTFTDESVNVMNSLLLLEAYKKKNCNAECHIYPMGGHGLSVCTIASADGNKEKISPYIARWTEEVHLWIKYKIEM